MKTWILALAFLISFSAQAEYRVFLLEFKTAEGELIRTQKSNLDPMQYLDYYPVPPGQTVSYTQTWMCFGDTSYQNYCKSPQEIATEKAENAGDNPESPSVTPPTASPAIPPANSPAADPNITPLTPRAPASANPDQK